MDLEKRKATITVSLPGFLIRQLDRYPPGTRSEKIRIALEHALNAEEKKHE